MSLNFSDLIYVVDDTLTPEFCEHVIKKFESDDQKSDGCIGSIGGPTVDKSVKDSMDLNISHYENWSEEDSVFFDCLNKQLFDYINREILSSNNINLRSRFSNLDDTGYQIQRTTPGGGYIWHTDSMLGYHRMRVLTFIWYLNDIEEDGYTEFMDGTKVQPKTGRFCLFPATWEYFHRGYPPKSQTKYICTGWLHK
jgi:hypothetical protein